jgi:hypothetical protein
MTPRHFADMNKNPINYDREIKDTPNLWYAFTAITGIEKMAKLFMYIPEELSQKDIKPDTSK